MQRTERITYGQVAGATALVLATLTVLYVTYRLSAVVLLFILSVVVAAALREPMLRLQRRGLPRSLAVLLLYLLIIATIGLLTLLIGNRIVTELERAGQHLPVVYDSLIMRWSTRGAEWQQMIAARLPLTPELLSAIEQNGAQIAWRVLGATYGVINILISLAAILTLTFYWLMDEDRFLRLWLLLLPVQQRVVARNVWRDIETRVGTFVRSEAVQFVLTLVLLWLGLSALGLAYPATWALYGAIVQLIPWVGIPLTLLPALIVLLSEGLPVALGAIILIIAVGLLMDQGIERRMGATGMVHPIVSIVALMVLGELAGLPGMLIALPLAATVQAVLSQLLAINTSGRGGMPSIYATQLAALRERLQQIAAAIPREGERRRTMESLVQRVEGLLTMTEQEVLQRAAEPATRRMPAGGAQPRQPSGTRRR